MVSGTVCSKVLTVFVAVTIALHCNAQCDPDRECKFVQYQNGTKFEFDFSALCSTADYVKDDNVGHTYYSNICGYARQNCLPSSWQNVYEYGVAVQMWGSTPACDQKNCQHKNGELACCTKDCQVLGVGEPEWKVRDPDNIYTGGILATYRGSQPSGDDPFWCPFDPTTGLQEERKVTMVLQCNYEVDVEIVDAVQNSSDDCHYHLLFNTKYACANNLPDHHGGGGGGGISGGWVFIILLFVVGTLYIAGGIGYNKMKNDSLVHPHVDAWNDFGALVKEGCVFTASGFKSSGSSGGFKPQYGSEGVGTQSSYTSYQGDAAPKADAYTDL